MTSSKLSPAAQIVWEAFNSKFDWVEDGVPGPQFHSIAAALRAVADYLEYDWDGFEIADYLCSLAAELEALPDD